MYNSTGSAEYKNCWDFVAEGVHPQHMDIDLKICWKELLIHADRR